MKSARNADSLDEIIFRYLHSAERGRGIGFSSNLRVRFFVDLLSAAHERRVLTRLVNCVVSSIRAAKVDVQDIGVVTPKWGNTLLGRAVAVRLSCPSTFFKADPLFGRWFEGTLARDRHWALVDDVASDGERLEELVERGREAGLKLRHAFFVIERTEGDVRALLTASGVEVHAAVQLDDRALDELQVRMRPGAPRRMAGSEALGSALSDSLLKEAERFRPQ